MTAVAIPAAATRIIVEFEGFSSHAYLDRIAKPNVWTIGTGFTKGVRPGQTITRTQNAKRLVRELQEDYAPAVLRACKRKPNANELSALLSFTFNCGPGAVGADTGVGRALRAGNFELAADRMLDWCKAGGQTIYGLLRRRRAERALMLRPAGRDSDGRFEVLTKGEREKVDDLLARRRIAHRHGGWDHVDESHLREARKDTAWLAARLGAIEHGDGAHRPDRRAYMGHLIKTPSQRTR